MKILLLLLIYIFTVTVSPLKLDPSKKRVLLIGVDSMFRYSLNKSDHTIFDYMMKEGSFSFLGRTTIQSISGPGWSTILCGMDSEDTGITDNDWYAPWMFGGKVHQITPVTGANEPFPCIFSELKKNNKNLKIKISYDWEFFINFGNLSFPGSLDKEDYCDTIDGSLHGYDKCDNEILRNTLLNIREDFDFIFTYFGSVDECGHEKGFDNEEYRQYVGKINNFIEIIFDELKYHGIFDSTYIIITADHGVQPQTKWHGEWNDINIHIPWFIKGPNIKKNYQIKSKIKNADTAPTIMHIFGFEPSNIWRSKVVNEIFITEKERLMRRYKNKLK
jgi:hypothetical protein